MNPWNYALLALGWLVFIIVIVIAAGVIVVILDDLIKRVRKSFEMPEKKEFQLDNRMDEARLYAQENGLVNGANELFLAGARWATIRSQE